MVAIFSTFLRCYRPIRFQRIFQYFYVYSVAYAYIILICVWVEYLDCWKQTTKKGSFTSLLINDPINLSASTTSYLCLYIFSSKHKEHFTHWETAFLLSLSNYLLQRHLSNQQKIVSNRNILICIVLMPILIQTGRNTKSSNFFKKFKKSISCFPHTCFTASPEFLDSFIKEPKVRNRSSCTYKWLRRALV